MNLIALLLMVLGLVLMVLGMFWALRRSRVIGVGIALVGLSLAIFPSAVSLSLTR